MDLRKQDLIVAAILILSLSAIIYYYLNNKCISVKYSIEAETFKSSINTIYEVAISYHAKNSNTLTYGRINGEACSSFDDSVHNVNYQLSFDTEGNMTEFYAYNNQFEVEIKSNNIVEIDVNSVVIKHKDLEVDCNGKRQKVNNGSKSNLAF